MENKISIIYQDKRVVIAIKPVGVLSTDEKGGMPELIRETLDMPQGCVRTVHRLDRVVGGVMVFARSAYASRDLSRQIREHVFVKQYWAVIHGIPAKKIGVFKDLLVRDRFARKTMITSEYGKDVQEAVLEYQVLDTSSDFSLVEIKLETGRTHQIRAQFAHHGYPLVGDRKYGIEDDADAVALWSCRAGFRHPETGKWIDIVKTPPRIAPWDMFSVLTGEHELLDIVDDDGQPTGFVVDREMAHRCGIQHRTSHVWLLRKTEDCVQVLLQKRSEQKDSYPGCYDISSAGHIPAGAEYITSALRELEEELGYTALESELVYCGQRRFSFRETFHGKPFFDRQVSNIYALWTDKDSEEFVLQSAEVSEVRWFKYEDCIKAVAERSIPHCIYLEELKMLQTVIKQ